MRKVRINVTQKDINSGKEMCTKRCPIARASLRKFKTVTVNNNGTIWLERKKYKLSEKAQNFINKFDRYGKMGEYGENPLKPFSFIINIRD